MDDQQLLRYNRQIMLPQIDIKGQQTLLDAHVMIIGLGGLGSPAAMYLATSGVGTLSLVDFDKVELSNMQRQIIHKSECENKLKVESASQTVKELNPEIETRLYSEKMNQAQLAPLLKDVDLLMDCSDNFETRYALNDLALQNNIPLVSGAAIGFDGQISVFDFRKNNSPCYRCLYPEGNEENRTCSENGVLGPTVGVIGCLQSLEAIKLLLNIGESLCGYLLAFDGMTNDWRKLKLKKDPECPVCSQAD